MTTRYLKNGSEVAVAGMVSLGTSGKNARNNPSSRPKLTWPANVVVARAHLDQLNRTKGISTARAATVKSALDKAAKDSAGKAAVDQLEAVAKQVEQDATSASGQDAARLKSLAATMKARAARLRG